MRALLATALMLTSGCGLITRARPTPRGVLAVEAALAGPAVVMGAPIPLPLATAGASYGIAEKADLSAHTHLTTLATYRLAGFDLGGSFLAMEQRGGAPAVSLGARGYAFTHFSDGALLYADASATASWLLRERFLSYVDLTAQWSLWEKRVVLAPALGEEVQFGRLGLQLEARWHDPFYDTRGASAPWLSPFKRGAVGFAVGARYRFPSP
ncbi:MAG: hypothetical protein HYZ28_08845 [Myxococcales bacterium]|nr:hypothetical protein [Myxococcales bacterium]